MARGTGYPLGQDNDATVQPSQGINADAMSTAQSWERIAATGRRVADASLDYAQREMQQARVGYLAGAEVEARRERIRLRDQHTGNPDAFDRAWTAYTDGRLSQAEPWAVPHLRPMLGREGNAAYESLLAERRSEDRRLDRDRITTLANQAADDVMGAAMGGDFNSDRWASSVTRLRGVLDSAVNAGLMTPDAAATRMQNIMSRAAAEAVVRSLVDTYRGNLAAGTPDAVENARREAERLLAREDTPELAGLTAAERRAYVGRAMAEVRALDGSRRMDLQEARIAMRDLQTAMAAGVRPNQETVDGIIERLEASGGHAEAARLRAAVLRQPRLEALGRMPLGEQLSTFSNMATDSGAGFAPDVNTALETAANESGLNVSLLRRFARIESGGRPDARSGSHRGLFQLSEAEWARWGQGGDINNPLDNARAAARKLQAEIGEFRTRHGREPTALDLYMVHQQGAAGYAAHLGNPGGAAWQNVRRYYTDEEARRRGFADGDAYARAAIWGNTPESERRRFPNGVDSVTSEDFVRIWRRRIGGSEEGGPDMPLVIGARRIIQSTAREMWKGLDEGMTAGRAPTPDQLREVARAAQLLGDDELLDTMGARLGRFYASVEVGRSPLTAQEGVRTGLETAENLPPGAQGLLTDAQRIIQETRQGLTNDPIALGARRFPELIALPPPLDLTDRDRAIQGLRERERISQFVGQQFGDSTLTSLGAEDRTAIIDAITSGDPRRMQNAFAVLADVRDESFAPTLRNPQILEAIKGAARSNNVATFTAAMQALDRMWARAPQEFATIFGQDMVSTLQDWQGRMRYHTAEELAETLKRRSREDPQAREARQRVEADGLRIANRMTIDNLLSALDPSWWPGDQPGAPLDARTRDMALGDYRRLFVERFAATGDEATARQQTIERMRLHWGASAVSGGRLMLRPPEREYPAVNGSHRWMQQELQGELRSLGIDPFTGRTTQLDPELGTASLAVPRGYRQSALGPIANDLPEYSLHADRTTETDISNGRPASYLVMVRRSDGTVDMLRDATGQPLRFRWDRSRVTADAREEFRRQRERVLTPPSGFRPDQEMPQGFGWRPMRLGGPDAPGADDGGWTAQVRPEPNGWDATVQREPGSDAAGDALWLEGRTKPISQTALWPAVDALRNATSRDEALSVLTRYAMRSDEAGTPDEMDSFNREVRGEHGGMYTERMKRLVDMAMAPYLSNDGTVRMNLSEPELQNALMLDRLLGEINGRLARNAVDREGNPRQRPRQRR
jgi:hypothetical protein